MNKLTKLTKLKLFLWLVVYAYFIYVLLVHGPSAGIVLLLAAAIVVSLMQVWLHSATRKRLRRKVEEKNSRKDD